MRVLRQIPDAQPAGPGNHALAWLLQAQENAQQRRLAGAIGAHESHLVAASEGYIDPSKDVLCTKVLGEVMGR